MSSTYLSALRSSALVRVGTSGRGAIFDQGSCTQKAHVCLSSPMSVLLTLHHWRSLTPLQQPLRQHEPRLRHELLRLRPQRLTKRAVAIWERQGSHVRVSSRLVWGRLASLGFQPCAAYLHTPCWASQRRSRSGSCRPGCRLRGRRRRSSRRPATRPDTGTGRGHGYRLAHS